MTLVAETAVPENRLGPGLPGRGWPRRQYTASYLLDDQAVFYFTALEHLLEHHDKPFIGLQATSE